MNSQEIARSAVALRHNRQFGRGTPRLSSQSIVSANILKIGLAVLSDTYSLTHSTCCLGGFDAGVCELSSDETSQRPRETLCQEQDGASAKVIAANLHLIGDDANEQPMIDDADFLAN